jgi:hypothetical protein
VAAVNGSLGGGDEQESLAFRWSEENARGVGRLDSTPARRVSGCFGPLLGQNRSTKRPTRVLIGPGFYTLKPVKSPRKTLAPNEA